MVDRGDSETRPGTTRRGFVVALGGSAAVAALPASVLAASRPAPPAPRAPEASAQTQPLTPEQFAEKMRTIASALAKLRADAKIILSQYVGHVHTYTLGRFGLTTLNLGAEGELPVMTLDSEDAKRSTAMLEQPPAINIAVSASSITGQTFDQLYAQLPNLAADADAVDGALGRIRASYELHTHTVMDHQQGFYVKPIYKKNYKIAASASDYSVKTEKPALVTVRPSAQAAATLPPLYVPSLQENFLAALYTKIVGLEGTARGLAQCVSEHEHPYVANDFQVVPISYNGFTLRVLEAQGPRTVKTSGVVIV